MGMKRHGRLVHRLGISFAIMLAAAAGLHMLAWRWATRRLESEFALVVEQRRCH